MPMPTQNPVGEEFYDELEPHTHAEGMYDYPLAKFVEALTRGAEEIENLVRDEEGDPGWSKLLDIDRVPTYALPWLGQFIGLEPPERLRLVDLINYLPKPSMETGVLCASNSVSSVGQPASTNIQTTEWKRSGTYSQLYTVTRDDGAAVLTRYGSGTGTIPVLPGETIAIRMFAYLKSWPVGRPNIRCRLYWYKADGTASTTPANDLLVISGIATGDEVELYGISVAPADAAFGAPALYFATGAAVVGEVIQVASDDWLYTKVPTGTVEVPEYWDGDSPNGRWQGARQNSISELYRNENDEEYSARVKPLILARLGWARGTPAAMRAAVQQYLTGGKQIAFRERTPTPYSIQIRTLTSETPDSTLVLRELLKLKPAGLRLDYATVAGQDFLGVESTHTDFAAVETDYPTFANMEADF